ncbi:MAG: Npt1/Npt2 family nucleotide transporter [Candidatus Babeliales bacterium]
MSNRIVSILWGDLRGGELKKFVLLALGFFCLIGSWWPLKTLKDGVFINLVGAHYLPLAKMLSLALFFPMVLLYSKLVDQVSKQKLIYFFITFYGSIGLVFVYFLHDPVIGLGNLAVGPHRWLGWAFFVYAESFISLMLSLYQSFINDILTPESAKKGYGLIIFGAQFGGFLFTLLGNFLSSDPSLYIQRVPLIAFISIMMIFMIAIIVFILEHSVERKHLQGYQEHVEAIDGVQQQKTENIGFLEGLRLLFTHAYVAGIFGLIFFQELISTLMGFQMSLLVESTIKDPGMVNKFLFDFAFAVQAIACLFGLLGTSFFQRNFGIRFCLTSYPIFLGMFIIAYLYSPTLSTIFYVMLIAKALNFAFNQPAKEVLYIPTSRDIKYKSKAWIDMFGLRFAKASGSFFNQFAGAVVAYSGFFAIGLIAVWTVLGSKLGSVFKKTVDNNRIIG